MSFTNYAKEAQLLHVDNTRHLLFLELTDAVVCLRECSKMICIISAIATVMLCGESTVSISSTAIFATAIVVTGQFAKYMEPKAQNFIHEIQRLANCKLQNLNS